MNYLVVFALLAFVSPLEGSVRTQKPSHAGPLGCEEKWNELIRSSNLLDVQTQITKIRSDQDETTFQAEGVNTGANASMHDDMKRDDSGNLVAQVVKYSKTLKSFNTSGGK
eukprot:525218_1